MVSVFKNVDIIRDRELKKALSMLGKKIGPEESKTIEQLSHAIVEGILSTPMNNLRKEIEVCNGNKEEIMKMADKVVQI